MKYVIIPILKLFAALLMTAALALATISTSIFFTLWDLKFYEGVGFDSKRIRWDEQDNISPYVTLPPRYTTLEYKTIFHYIWNINPQIIQR